MALTNSISAYGDCRDLFERAINAPTGIRVFCETHGQAVNLRQRLYRFRQLERKENSKIYPETDPLHNGTVYDSLIVDVVETALEIRIRAPLRIEEI